MSYSVFVLNGNFTKVELKTAYLKKVVNDFSYKL